MNRKILKKVITAAAAAALIMTFTVSGFAGSSLLTPGTSRTIAGSSFDFTLNVKSLDGDSSDIEAEDVTREYVVALSVSPEISALSVKEGIGSVNAVTGEYQVTSSQLGDTSVLHFSVTPSESITSETTYTVSVNVSGDVKASDSFNLIVVPKETQETPETPDTPDSPDTPSDQGENTPDQQQPDMNDSKMPNGSFPSGKMSGKKFSMSGNFSGGTAASSTASNLIYAGSWDNYLDALSADGYEFTQKFNKTRDTYFITVPMEVTSLDIEATPSDDSATVAITGSDDIPKGRSKIMVNVTADDGSVRVYRIYVDRTEQPEDENDAEETNV